jgi:5-methylcytosine-specific restriction protein A
MDEKTKQRSEELTHKTEPRGGSYWQAWIASNGDALKVARDFGVSRDTVSWHLTEQSRINGFDGLNHAKRHFGFSRIDSESKVSSSTLKTILEMQGYKCALSGKRLTPESASLDHKIPLSRGGTNDASNLQWVDSNINRAKGSMDCDEFVEMCKSVAKQARG